MIQYYFGTKEALLQFTMEHLARWTAERVKARTRSAADPMALTEALSTDEDSRVFNIVYTSYAALSLTDPAYAIETLLQVSDVVENVVTAQLTRAQQAGQGRADMGAQAEATRLLAMSTGLRTSVLADQRSAEDALGVLRYHLDRLLPPDRPLTGWPGASSGGPADLPAKRS